MEDINVQRMSGDPDVDSSSDYDTELEDNEETIKASKAEQEQIEHEMNVGIGSKTYEVICEKLHVVPIRKLLDQLPTSVMRLHHIRMNTAQCKALSCALMHNTCLETLELKDNGLSGEDIVLIVNVIKYNGIFKLGFPDNCLTNVGAMAVDEMIRATSILTHLNLSGCKLGDTETEYIASGLHYNTSLIWLDLSKNNISSEGGKNLGRSIGESHTLKSLNLSWNHIRMEGAVGLLKGLQVNDSMIYLDLTMNGLGFEGCLALESTLKENKCLKYLDITNNRISWDGISFIAKGLKKNTSLEVLKIGSNPINMEGCYYILKSVSHLNSKVKHVGFDNIPVNGAVLTVASDILKTRPFSFTHGGILETRDVVGIRKEKPEDPISLVVRYLASIGIRMIDLYRMLDNDNDGHVTKKEFIKGMKKLRIPICDRDLRNVAARLDYNENGFISYSVLTQGVKTHMRQERKEDKRQEVKKRTKLEERRRILETELPVLFKRNYADDLTKFYGSQSLSNMDPHGKGSTANIDRVSNSTRLTLPDIKSGHSLTGEISRKRSTMESELTKSSSSLLSTEQTNNLIRQRFRRPLEMLKVINAFVERNRYSSSHQSPNGKP